MFALNVFSICALAVLVWTAHELCLLPVARRERALRRLSALLLGVNILKYALPPLLGGKLVLPVEFSAAAYFTTPGIILMTRGKLRCWAAYAGLLAGGVYYGAMCLAGGYIYGANPPAQVLLSLFCHGSLLVLGLTVTGTERFGPRDAALLPLGVAGVAARAALLRPWAGGGTLLIYGLLDARALRSSGLTGTARLLRRPGRLCADLTPALHRVEPGEPAARRGTFEGRARLKSPLGGLCFA